MTIEENMQQVLDETKRRISGLTREIKQKQSNLVSLRKEYQDKIKAKSLFFGYKIPSKPKKKVENQTEVK